jgi:hypothetical protein
VAFSRGHLQAVLDNIEERLAEPITLRQRAQLAGVESAPHGARLSQGGRHTSVLPRVAPEAMRRFADGESALTIAGFHRSPEARLLRHASVPSREGLQIGACAIKTIPLAAPTVPEVGTYVIETSDLRLELADTTPLGSFDASVTVGASVTMGGRTPKKMSA